MNTFWTATTTVFCILFEITTPTFVCRALAFSFVSVVAIASPLTTGPLTEQCFDPRNLASHLTHLAGVLHPAGRALEPQLEELLAQVALARVELIVRLVAKLVHFHDSPISVCDRVTKRVLIGSLWDARRNASS